MSEDEQALSLMLSDHYTDRATLEQLSAQIAAGTVIKLDPETRINLIKGLRDAEVGMPAFLRTAVEKATDIDYEPPPPPPRRPWWRWLF